MSVRKRDKDRAKYLRRHIHTSWSEHNEYNVFFGYNYRHRIMLVDENGEYLFPKYQGSGYYVDDWIHLLHMHQNPWKIRRFKQSKRKLRHASKLICWKYTDDDAPISFPVKPLHADRRCNWY